MPPITVAAERNPKRTFLLFCEIFSEENANPSKVKREREMIVIVFVVM